MKTTPFLFAILSIGLATKAFAIEDDYLKMQRSLIQASAEKEICKKQKCGDRPEIFNLEETDKSFNGRVASIRKYNSCITDCDMKAVPVALDKYLLMKNETAQCEKYLPDPLKNFFHTKHLAQYNQDKAKNEYYIQYPTAEGSIMTKLEKRHTLCKDVVAGKYDKELHGGLMKELRSCQKTLKGIRNTPSALKAFNDIETFIKQRNTPSRAVGSLGADSLIVHRKLKQCSDEIAAFNSKADPKDVNQSARGLSKPFESFGDGHTSPLLYQETLGR